MKIRQEKVESLLVLLCEHGAGECYTFGYFIFIICPWRLSPVPQVIFIQPITIADMLSLSFS